MTVGSFGIGAKDGAMHLKSMTLRKVQSQCQVADPGHIEIMVFWRRDQSIAHQHGLGPGHPASLSLPYSPVKIAVYQVVSLRAGGSEAVMDNSNTVVDGTDLLNRHRRLSEFLSDGVSCENE